MSASAPKACPRHPASPVGTVNGACWTCAGRPPDWYCGECKQPVGRCEHLGDSIPPSSLTEREAEARARVGRTAGAIVAGVGSWEMFERELTEYAREVRAAWGERLERARRN